MHRIAFVDSHTGGEPTRLLLAGFPDLGDGPLALRRARLLAEHDAWRRAAIGEPRGHEALVGAILVPPHEPGCAFGVIFVNDVGALGMCGHGLIGVVASLAHLGRLAPGAFRVDTPVGPVACALEQDGAVTFENVPSRVLRRDLALTVPGLGELRGELAWGGNGFLLIREPPLKLADGDPLALRAACLAIREALLAAGLGACEGLPIDHVELVARLGPGHYRNFVLCPGGAWDRSPCGTGTSALLASLAARGELEPERAVIVEGPTGSRFVARYRDDGEALRPRITGRAHPTAVGELLFAPDDPSVP